MKNNSTEEQNEDAPFGLPVENELLMLKLRAEFGAECSTGQHDIPPVVVNEFLRSVYEFEQKFRESNEKVTVYQKLGKPPFMKQNDLDDNQVAMELKRMMRKLNAHHIQLDVLGEYQDRIIYTFITEELFLHEMDDLVLPGYTHHFCYEEFHPNHELEIRRVGLQFIEHWFKRSANEYCPELANQFIHPDTRIFSKEQVLQKIANMLDAYPVFANEKFVISGVTFEWDEKKESGRGYMEGSVSYDARNEANEWVCFKGPFTLYFSCDLHWWDIFYFVFPGFSWND